MLSQKLFGWVMKLIKFRIENYKSIKDSGWCFTANDVTVLAGKNESGKTAALEALRDFDKSVQSFPEAVYPLEEVSNHYPTVSIVFSLSDEEQKSVLDATESSMKDQFAENSLSEIYITKTANSAETGNKAEYECPEIRKILGPWHSEQMQSFREKYEETFQLLSEKGLSTELRVFSKAKSPTKLWEFSDEIHNEADANIERISDTARKRTEKEHESASDSEVESTDDEVEIITKYTEEEETLLDFYKTIMAICVDMDGSLDSEKELIDAIISYTPNFVFFSSFEDTLPFEIPVEDVTKNTAVQDFFRAAEINLKQILARKDRQRRDNALRTKSMVITGDFQTFWQQDTITLKPHIDGENLVFEFEEEGKIATFSFDQRSKGFQWFLTFYLKLMVEGSKAGNDILLIDEPGLYLHAKAQKDVLKLFERLSEEGGHVVISTHSPYLIDVNHLNRVKLVSKSKIKGTKIQNKVHANAAKDTLTPIITAIGLDIGATLQSNYRNNIITEGISDYYYLLATAKLISFKKDDIAIIPSTGAPSTPNIASILIGWGLEVSVLLDNDTAGRAAKKKLEKLDLTEGQIIIPDTEGAKIEDIFTNIDFQTFVIESAQVDASKTNQQIITEQRHDKVLLAKNFYEKVLSGKIEKTNFTEETIEKISKLWATLRAGFP